MKNMNRCAIRAVLAIVFLVLSVSPGRAQEALTVDIFGPGQGKVNVCLAEPVSLRGDPRAPEDADKLKNYLNANLSILPFLELVPGSSVLGGAQMPGVKAEDIDFRRFSLSRVDIVVTMGWKDQAFGRNQVELRAYEVFTERLIIGWEYTVADDAQIRRTAAKFAAELMRALTGHGDFFETSIAFTRRTEKHKEIWTVTPMGEELRQLTKLDGLCLSPAWSRNGRYLLFTYVDDMAHHLGYWDAIQNKFRAVQLPGSTIIGPAFTADGRVAVSIDPGGNPEIYLLNENLKVDRPLVQSWAIDVSPSFDAKGEKMAFVSSRLGNPHIFVMDLKTGEVERVSYRGKYNTDPSISPDGRLIAYSRRTDYGHRIIVHDLVSGLERQVTFGSGNDETPTFAPDGYFIVFSSNRSGQYKLYLTTRHGDDPVEIPTGSGEATAPAWRPAVSNP